MIRHYDRACVEGVGVAANQVVWRGHRKSCHGSSMFATFQRWISRRAAILAAGLARFRSTARLDDRRSALLLRQAIDGIAEGVVLFDADDRLVLFNDSFRKMNDAAGDAIKRGALYEDILRAATSAGSQDWLAERLYHHRYPGGAIDQELESGRWLRIKEQRIGNSGTIGLWSDITDQKRQDLALKQNEDRMRAMLNDLESSHAQLERQAIQLNQLANENQAQRLRAESASAARAQFIANINHELRTPLNSILGFAAIMKSEMLGTLQPPQYRDYAGDIHDCGQQLLSLIDDLLDMAQIEAGQLELVEEACDMAELVRDAAAGAREQALVGNIDLNVLIPAGLPQLRGDYRLLQKAMLKLLSNAIKSTAPGGVVEIQGTQMGDGAIQVKISDTGIGMSPDQLRRAFEPYGRFESPDGGRLALPIARALIELHGGLLTLNSELGTGTNAIMTLPHQRSIKAAADNETP